MERPTLHADRPSSPLLGDDEPALEFTGASADSLDRLALLLRFLDIGLAYRCHIDGLLLCLDLLLMLGLAAELLHELREALVAHDEVLVLALRRNRTILERVDVVALREEV